MDVHLDYDNDHINYVMHYATLPNDNVFHAVMATGMHVSETGKEVGNTMHVELNYFVCVLIDYVHCRPSN